MSHPRRALRLDANHDQIVEAALAMGASVQSLVAVGAGCPDLLLGYCGRNLLIEVKDGRKPQSARGLTDAERFWHGKWRGSVAVVESAEDLARVLGGANAGIERPMKPQEGRSE